MAPTRFLRCSVPSGGHAAARYARQEAGGIDAWQFLKECVDLRFLVRYIYKTMRIDSNQLALPGRSAGWLLRNPIPTLLISGDGGYPARPWHGEDMNDAAEDGIFLTA